MTDKWTEREEQKRSVEWERTLIEKITMASVEESRRARRWGIFFKFLTFAYLSVLIYLLLPPDFVETVKIAKKHTALVEVKGIIAQEAEASADNIVKGLRDAFEDKKTKGVILRINSPGGSPVQAGYIYDEIKRLKKKYPEIPVYAVAVDLCASGGYYIAAAADEIYADKGSIVGSIGVLMNSFGFAETMKKLGIERRLLTAGERKGIMDPFSPATEEDRQFILGLLAQLHQQFIDAVRAGRGERLKETEEIFSGLFWSGEEGVRLGLVDGLGSTSYVARELIKAEEIVDFTPKEDVFERFAKRIGVGVSEAFAELFGLSEAPHVKY
ncbi:MAG TPA: signal peptide peptidase SppA [Chromatiales bacterium]|nr:signal peptide peptidase SppA [Chromatiales bacterium]